MIRCKWCGHELEWGTPGVAAGNRYGWFNVRKSDNTKRFGCGARGMLNGAPQRHEINEIPTTRVALERWLES